MEVSLRGDRRLALLLGERHPSRGEAGSGTWLAAATGLSAMVYLANTMQPTFRLWFYPADAPQVDAE